MNLFQLIAKALGQPEKVIRNQRSHRVSKHLKGNQQPKDFDRKRKVRRQMAKQSRRINRRRL